MGSAECGQPFTARTRDPASAIVARHPEQVRTLIAHEPPLPELLPEAERQEVVAAQLAVEEAHRRDGAGAAMRAFAAVAGLDIADREPDVEMPRPNPGRVGDIEFFLTHDAPAVRRYKVDLEALRVATTRIMPAAGGSSRDNWPHHCADALAARLGSKTVESPGGHSGYVLRPRAFAAWLSDVLES